MQESFHPERDFEMRMRIFEALRNLTCGDNPTPLDSVTIKRLCEEASISARTFYNHFTDKYAVVVWFMETCGAYNFAQMGLTATPREALGAFVASSDKYRDFTLVCNESKYYSSIYAYLMKLSQEGLEYVAEQQLGTDEVPLLIRLQIRYFTISAEAVSADWLFGDIECSAEELVDLLCSLIPHELYKLIEKPLRHKGSAPLIDMTKMRVQGFEKYSKTIDRHLHTQPDGKRSRLRP